MKIVLLEKVDNLGLIGDVVSVKDGYARNFLLPQEKALRATKSNLIRFEAEREFLEARTAEAAEKARKDGSSLEGRDYVVIRQAGETGILYGSVSSRDIAGMIGGGVKRSMIALEKPIKELGLHEVRVKLHSEVSVNVTINVARTEDEARRQAAGEDVIATQLDQDKLAAQETVQEHDDATAKIFEGNHGEVVVAELSDDTDMTEITSGGKRAEKPSEKGTSTRDEA